MSDVKTDLADLKDIAGPAVVDAPVAADADAETVTVEPPVSTMPLREQELDKFGRAYATGRRKDAVARVWLKPGKGTITVNGRDQETYFARPTLTKYEPTLRAVVKAAGFLTRDSRKVERKKYGKAKARKSFQFSKR